MAQPAAESDPACEVLLSGRGSTAIETVERVLGPRMTPREAHPDRPCRSQCLGCDPFGLGQITRLEEELVYAK